MYWLLLVVSLPTENATARMRSWRALKNLGCASLRDGVWLLPAHPKAAARLRDIAEDMRKSGGEAWVLTLQADPQQADSFPTLFDRGAEYGVWLDELTLFDPLAADLAATRKQLKALSKRLTAITDTDYFPHPLQTLACERLQLAETAMCGRRAAIEPTFQQDEPERLNAADFQGRYWATRRDLWVDRLASAWLIRRFIDTNARFLWMEDPNTCPPEALGFDFDGARFTHTGCYVTFETLLVSFGLEQDSGLQRLGHLVHALDVGGTAPEAAGFAAVLKGLQYRTPDDDALLAAGGQLLDDFYCAFSIQEDSP